jgi:hypothetical protein
MFPPAQDAAWYLTLKAICGGHPARPVTRAHLTHAAGAAAFGAVQSLSEESGRRNGLSAPERSPAAPKVTKARRLHMVGQA